MDAADPGQRILRAAYQAQQAALRLPLLGLQQALRLVAPPEKAAPAPAVGALRREYEALLARDLENVARGAYPASLLFQLPIGRYAARVPGFLLDLPAVVRRYRDGRYEELPVDAEPRRYPPYYRRTFHWQTDGYLSDRSAELYDLGVEILFLGCADVMRRQVLPPLARFAAEGPGPLRIGDAGCGTGRTLHQLARALPGHRYVGIDLSPYYLEEARRLLGSVRGVTLLAENAETLPFRDGYLDAMTSVFLFHELPGPARRRVAAELRRCVRPGGLVVVCDAAQLVEAQDLEFFLDAFSREMHEPFFSDYIDDPLEEVLHEAGLEVEATERAWLSKVVVARRPAPARG